MKFLDADSLENSAVVANCRMNRERELTGSNGYASDLGFNPAAWLESNSHGRDQVSWLDLCCGSGSFPFRFIGADDESGPNYTGQPAVDSFYERWTPNELEPCDRNDGRPSLGSGELR